MTASKPSREYFYSLGRARISADFLHHLLYLSFWKESNATQTEEDCNEKAEIVLRRLDAIEAEPYNYMDEDENYRKRQGD